MKAYFITLFLILTGVFALNSWVDVTGLRTYGETYQLGRRQTEKELLIRKESFDQRAWVKAKLEAGQCPDILILGSSTLGGIGQSAFPGKRIINAWLSGPNPEDFEAITSVLENVNCRPHTILFGIDPWYFNPTDINLRWLSIKGDSAAYKRKHASFQSYLEAQWSILLRSMEPIQERLSYQSTRESLKSLRNSGLNGISLDPPKLLKSDLAGFCSEAKIAHYIRFYDGHWDTCRKFERTSAEVALLGKTYVKPGDGLGAWNRIDTTRVTELEQLIQIWRKNGAEVILVAPPHNPFAYASLMSSELTRPRLAEMDRMIEAVAGRTASVYLNLRDPATLGCSIEDFRDAYHLKPTCSNKLGIGVNKRLSTQSTLTVNF